MDFTFDFELCVETERYEREYLFAMSGYAYYSNAIYTEDDCFAGLNFSEHITLIEIKRASNGTPIALLLRCTECDIGANEQIIEHEMLMGDELYVSNVTYYIDYHYRLRLKRRIRYTEKMNGALIWVDEKDNEIGYGDKLITHRDRILHRAFSVFIYNWNDKKMLLQCRADTKYHSGGLWCNACCSHPKLGEKMIQTINSRLNEELGYSCNFSIVNPEYPDSKIDLNNALLECGTFIYHSDYGNIGEDELDHVFLLFTDRDDISESCTTTFDVEEVKAIRWMNINDIESELNDNPLLYSTWFRPAYTLALKELKSQASFRRIAIDN